jgi:hypothetical protein
MKIALLTDLDRVNAATIGDSINGFVRHSKHSVTALRFFGNPHVDLSHFDVLIIHYSLIAYPFGGDGLLSSEFRVQISRFRGKKIAWIQDEYRNILERNRFLNSLGIHHVLTLANDEVAKKIYDPQLVKVSTSRVLAGYVPDYFMDLVERRVRWENRAIEIGYRARKLPSWMGQLGREKYEIGQLILNSGVFRDSKVNISSEEDDRLYGQKWMTFLLQTKVALGTESGCSTLDFDGRLSADWVSKSARGECDRVAAENSEYSAVSPRIFEYAAAGNIMALYSGEYSGVLEPWGHYFPLERDGSNLKALKEFMNDPSAVQSMIERVDREILGAQKYGHPELARQIDRVCEKLTKGAGKSGQNRRSGEVKFAPLPPNAEVETRLRKFNAIYESAANRLAAYKWVPLRKQAVIVNRKVKERLSELMEMREFRLIVRLGPTSIKDAISAAEQLNLDISVLRQEISKLYREVVSALNASIGVELHESETSIWIQWRANSNPQAENHVYLQNFPRMTFEALPLAVGAFSSRAEFAETGIPQKYNVLTQLFSLDSRVVRSLYTDLSQLRSS